MSDRPSAVPTAPCNASRHCNPIDQRNRESPSLWPKRAQAAKAYPHVTDIKLLGWKPALVGTCADESGNQMNGMKKGDTTTLMSQRACAAACDADAGCIGYQHGKGECIAFGATAGAGWTSVTGAATAITTSDTTATEYICVLPCGTGHTTLTATFDACTLGARYHEVGTSGGCRGNGGSNDRINSKEGQSFTRAECEAACDTDTNCVGYASVSGGSQSCVLYGPGIAGSCNKPAAKTKEHCTGYGTCTPSGTVTIVTDRAAQQAATNYGTALSSQTVADCRDSGDKTSTACVTVQSHGGWDVRDGKWLTSHSDWKNHQEFCGFCAYEDGRPLGQTKAACTGGYTWVDWTWTPAPGVWTDPVEDDPRFDTYEYQTTTHIHTSSPSAGVQCYELDNKDHDNQCHGIDSHDSATGTATREDSFCQATFEAADTSTAADCPSGCVYHAKPVMQGNIKAPTGHVGWPAAGLQRGRLWCLPQLPGPRTGSPALAQGSRVWFGLPSRAVRSVQRSRPGPGWLNASNLLGVLPKARSKLRGLPQRPGLVHPQCSRPELLQGGGERGSQRRRGLD